MRNEPPQKSRRRSLPIRWLRSILACVIVLAVSFLLGKAFDCSPHQVDGQCGLTIFMGILVGVAVDIAILVFMLVDTITQLITRHKARQRSN